MQRKEIITILDSKVTSTRENRTKIAAIILKDPSLFLPLLEISLDADNPVSVKAAWVLEFVVKQQLNWISPHLIFFTKQLPATYKGGAVRALTKICELIAKDYSAKNSYLKKHLSNEQIDEIIEVSFDRLISNHKVAVKVYAMETLFLFGKERDWVHDALKLTILQEISNGSAAYKARGKRTLLRIQKLEKQ